MVILGLPAEARDDVGADGAIRHVPADARHALHVPSAVIAPVHALQHRTAAALHGQVDVLADVVVPGHHLQHLVGHVLRMAGAVADPQARAGQGHHFQEIGEIHRGPGAFRLSTRRVDGAGGHAQDGIFSF